MFCTNETRASLLRYRMEVMHPMRVTAVGTKDELAEVLLRGEAWDGMVHIVSLRAPNQEIAAMMTAAAGEATVRVEIWPERERELFDHNWSTAHRKVWTHDPGVVCPVVVDAMRRKRGPKRPLMCRLGGQE